MTSTMLDRFVRWNLDFDGDLYGEDERERLRWYEGIATAASVIWIALPWSAVVLVLVMGRPAVLPTGVMLAMFLVPMVMSYFYVERSRVETIPRRYGRKRVLLQAATGLPWVVYTLAAMHAWQPDSGMTWGGVVGGIFGGAIGVWYTYRQVLKRRERDAAAEATVLGDED